jgi:hypothetical protein
MGRSIHIQTHLCLRPAPTDLISRPLPSKGCFSIALLIKKNTTPAHTDNPAARIPKRFMNETAAIAMIAMTLSVLSFFNTFDLALQFISVIFQKNAHCLSISAGICLINKKTASDRFCQTREQTY